MTKWRGRVVSIAPQLGLATAAIMSFALPVEAACTSGGAGQFDCTTPETTQQTLTSNGAPLTVNVDPTITFSAAQSGASAFVLTSDQAVSFTQASGGGTISGNNSGIRATNNGAGTLSITATGAITGSTGAGVFIVNSGNGTTVNVGDVTGYVHGINANNPGTGAVTITSTGTVEGTRLPVSSTTNSTGISVNQVNGTDITVTANNVSGGTYGINVNNTAVSTGGNTSVTALGDVSGGTGSPTGPSAAVNAQHDNSGFLDIDLQGLASSATGYGILANVSAAATTATINAQDITAFNDAVIVDHAGSGALSIDVAGTATSSTGSGMAVVTADTAGSASITANTITSELDAISVDHSGSGALGITATGTLTSNIGSGIVALNYTDGVTTTVAAADIDAALDGISVTQTGLAGLEVHVNGAVNGGSGAGLVNTAGSVGGAFTISAGGSLAATSGTAFLDAASGNSGSADSTLTVDGGLGGDVAMGAGADHITIGSTATLGAGITIDGDAGTASFTAGQIDTLEFAGWSGTIDGGQIANQEMIVLSGAADVTFGGTGLANENTTDGLWVEGGASSIARIASSFSLGGGLTNLGALDLSTPNGTADTTLTLAGDYIGGGQFVIDVDFAAELADTLLVGGDVSGTTYVVVNDVSSGAASGNGVVFASVTGTTAVGDFELASGTISVGAFDYEAQLAGTDWVLGVVVAPTTGSDNSSVKGAGAVAGAGGVAPTPAPSPAPTPVTSPAPAPSAPVPSPALNATAALYEAAPQILLGSFGTLPSYWQRQSQRQWLTGGNGEGFQGIWLRGTADRADVTPETSSAGGSYERTQFALQAGADFDLGDWVVGATAQYGDVSADVENALGTGSLDASGYGLGVTATWTGDKGSYVDLQGQVNWITADFARAATGVLLNDADMRSYSASVEIGHRYTVAPNRHLVPQMQLSWAKLDAGSFTDSQSSLVDFGNPESLIGRIGLAYEMTGLGADQSGEAYVIANILHDFSGSAAVGLGNTLLSSKTGGTSAEIGFGGTLPLSGGASIYAEGSYRSALGSAGSGTGYSISLGYRKSF